jgi:excisionase family DNA binding protein
MESTATREFMTTEELAQYLNFSVKSIEKHRVTGRIPGAVRVGRVWRFSRAEVNKRILSGSLLLPEDCASRSRRR